MNQTTEALKMAIEAMEKSREAWHQIGIYDTMYDGLNSAIFKCKEALASQDKVTRLEVIDNNGRSYVNWGVDKMEFNYQDDGRTLKIFTNGSGVKN
jgi:hypothetical protein